MIYSILNYFVSLFILIINILLPIHLYFTILTAKKIEDEFANIKKKEKKKMMNKKIKKGFFH